MTRWLRDLADRTLLPGAFRFTRYGYTMAGLEPVTDRLEGKTAVITGVTSGIGRAAAEGLARLGARVILVGRGRDRLEQVREEISAATGNDDLAAAVVDLSLVREVKSLARQLLDREAHIDILVNNAGALYAARAETDEGFERTFALNLLAPFVLTEALRPRFGPGARVVNVSSGGMYLQPLALDDLNYTQGIYDGTKAYARAKRALVALTQLWAQRWGGSDTAAGVIVHAMHPGWVATPGIVKSLPGFHRTMKNFLRTPDQGADTIVWLAASPQAAQANGLFWLDRQPHLTDILPNTAVSPVARIKLHAMLEEFTHTIA